MDTYAVSIKAYAKVFVAAGTKDELEGKSLNAVSRIKDVFHDARIYAEVELDSIKKV